MKKYTGLIVLTALAASSVLVVKAAPDERYQGRKATGISETQIGQLDKRLSERIVEQQELLAMVEKLLGRDLRQKTEERSLATNVLSGQAKPSVPTVMAKAVIPVVKAAEAPWWQEYRPQMVYLSGGDRYAVVNGKMYLDGQSLGKDVVIDKIELDSVVLRQGREHHTYFLKK